jgi:hypothetical protein
MRPQRGKTRAEARAPCVIVRRETLNMAAMHPRFPRILSPSHNSNERTQAPHAGTEPASEHARKPESAVQTEFHSIGDAHFTSVTCLVEVNEPAEMRTR